MVFKSLRAALLATALVLPAATAAPVLAQEDDPVVARVGDEQIRRSDLEVIKQSMAQQMPQIGAMPLDALFQPLVERAVDAKLLAKAGQDANVTETDAFQQRMEEARQRIVQQLYLEQTLEEAITDERIQEAYEQFKEENPPQPEVHARHILVETEEEAQALIEELEGGADFAELAQEHSTGPSGPKGGDLGWFTKDAMVEPFAAAAFAMDPGAVSESPVQTQFGWHVIKVEDRRESQPALDEVREQLRQQVAQEVIETRMAELREETEVEIYGPQGEAGENEGDNAAE